MTTTDCGFCFNLNIIKYTKDKLHGNPKLSINENILVILQTN